MAALNTHRSLVRALCTGYIATRNNSNLYKRHVSPLHTPTQCATSYTQSAPQLDGSGFNTKAKALNSTRHELQRNVLRLKLRSLSHLQHR
jgi:hypothetical protein